MGLKDFLITAGGIASAAASGGTSAAILAGISGVANMLGDDEKVPDLNDRKTQWRVERIQEWMMISRNMMQQPMAKGRKAELLREKIAADWFEFFGTAAKGSWVNQMAEQTWNAVKANIALGIIEAPTS